MKKQKLHVFPLETTFSRRIKTGVQYFNLNHYTNFSESGIEIKTFNDYSHDEHWPTNEIFEKVSKTLSLHNAKYLTKLQISIEASFLFNTSTLRKFGLTLAQSFKALKQLDLRFLSCRKLNGGNLRYLLDSLTKGMGHLTEVNLYFLACSDIDDQCLEDLKLFIVKRCKRLKKFKVIISGDYLKVDGEGYVYFKPDLDKRLRNPNFLIEFSRGDKPNQITSSGSASLCRGVAKYLKNLRSLTFKVDSQEEENDPSAQNILGMISNLPNLQDLNFSASKCHKINELSKLPSCIGKSLKNLQSLSLNFPHTDEITKKGYQQFTQDLFSSLPSQLTYFALNLESSPEVTDDIIRKIALNIAKNLKNLQTLILRFFNMGNLTGTALRELTLIISKSLPSLKKFVLSFDSCTEIDKNYSIMLPEQIQQFDLYLYNPSFSVHETWKGLNRISLNFDACSDKESFLDLFPKPSLGLKNLNELKLIYSQSFNIEDQHIKKLSSAIGENFEHLVSLELGFSHCSELTGDSLKFVGDKICKKLKNLRHLNIGFFDAELDGTYAFTEDKIKYLLNIITSKLGSLESLTLNFCTSIGEEMKLEDILDKLCSGISRNLKKLKKLDLSFDLKWNIELKRRIRERLCHIPIIYLR